MPERALDELLNGLYRVPPQELAGLETAPGPPLEAMVEAFYQGTCVVDDFYDKVVVPFPILKPSVKEDVAEGLILRISSALKSLVLMNSSKHFQTAMSAARAVFELMVSLDVLSREDGDTHAERLIAFTAIERHQDGCRIAEYEEERCRQGLPTATLSEALKVIQNDVLSREGDVRNLRKKWYVHRGHKKVRQWDWTGKNDLANLAQSLGGLSYEFYRRHYARLSWYAHGASLVAIQSLSANDFQRVFFVAHDVARECAVAAAIFYAKIVRLDAIPQFQDMIRKVREAPGAAIALYQLDRLRSENAS